MIVIIITLLISQKAKARTPVQAFPYPFPPLYPPNPNNTTNSNGNGNGAITTTTTKTKYEQAAADLFMMASTTSRCPVASGRTANELFDEIASYGVVEQGVFRNAWNEVSNDTQAVNVSGGVKGSASSVEVGGTVGTEWTINQSQTLRQALASFYCNRWYIPIDYCLDCALRDRAIKIYQ